MMLMLSITIFSEESLFLPAAARPDFASIIQEVILDLFSGEYGSFAASLELLVLS
jgi:hypothetical protein